jgi:hypothetical protein
MDNMETALSIILIFAALAGLYALAEWTERRKRKQLDEEFSVLLNDIHSCKSIEDVNLLFPKHLAFTLKAGGNKDNRAYQLQQELLLKRAEMLKRDRSDYAGDNGAMMGIAR